MSNTNKVKKFKALREISINQLGALKDVAARVANKVESYELLYPEFKARYGFIERIYSEFYASHNEIITLLAAASEETDAEEAIRADFDRDYFDVQIKYKEIFVKQETENAVTTAAPKDHIRLPQMQLYQFNGDFKNWRTFIDMFNSTIHTQPSLTNVEKFNYLISSLSNEPHSIVSRIPLTADNYQTAYDALIKRYDNKRLLATSYWQQIENAPTLSSGYTSAQLRNLLNIFDENLAALKTYKFPVDSWDFVLFNMLLKRLPSSLVTKFELDQESPTEIPQYKTLTEFLMVICQATDNASQNNLSKPFTQKLKSDSPYKPKTKSLFFLKSESPSCPLCKMQHSIYKCPTFLDKTPQSRYDLVKQNKWCINCLGIKHSVRNCNSSSTCRDCNLKHHSLLHFSQNSQKSIPVVTPAVTQDDPTPSTSSSALVSSLTNCIPSSTTVLLSTAVVEIYDQFGGVQKIRVLLDSASQSSFITESCVDRLHLQKFKSTFTIKCLQCMNTSANKVVNCTLKPINSNFPQFHVEAIVVRKICENMPSTKLSYTSWTHIVNLKLADDEFYEPRPVDMLLGADIFPQILESGSIQGKSNEPIAINTKFGWILMGKIDSNSTTKQVNSFSLTLDQNALDNNIIKRFWEIEEPPSIPVLSSDDQQAEQSFNSKFYRENTGRFVVPLIFKTEDADKFFPGSFAKALNRFFTLERRLAQDDKLRNEYVSFMRDYLEAGHMQLLSCSNPTEGYYIPHHSVSKSDATVSKFRVVFDGSCKSLSGESLNNALLSGPKLQKDIFTVLCRFRSHAYVLTADIRQMFRQILILPEHRKFQKIFWRFSPSDPIREYQLNTVTYGLACSPYLALRVLHCLSKIESNTYPLASNVLANDVYVDDIITGGSTSSAICQIRNELILLLEKGGFELRKWASNCPSVLENIPLDYRLNNPLSFDQESDSFVKILGLKWDPTSDSFAYHIISTSKTCTKRALLSELARIYDPIGFLAPLTFFAKCMIQLLWTLGLGWDEKPPSDILQRWCQYTSEFSNLSKLIIPRRLLPDNTTHCTLHGFCDASESGYAAVIYLRTVSSLTNQIKTQLVCAKSKVAPLKRISVPRLELCAAHLLSKLMNSIKSIFEHLISFDGVYAWSDSTVVLSWISSSPHRWKTFVSNRVAQIQNAIPASDWYHVSSQDNPADCASRGLTPNQLISHSLWWAGPKWLQSPDLLNSLPGRVLESSPTCQEEERKVVLASVIENDTINMLLNTFSSLRKIKGIIAWCQRFYHNIRHKNRICSQALTESDLQNALIVVVKHVQSQEFSSEIAILLSESTNSLPKPFRRLSPFLDSQGLLRVGGRLKQSALPFDTKHPILLPSRHRLTDLIIEEMHSRHLHTGTHALHYLLSQQFWILNAKRAISRVISRCLRCWHLRPQSLQPPMADLPKLRISQIKAFSCVGVDYGGPFHITLTKRRGCKSQKAYICLFVCFATKALHLELASDLSTESFLCALRRFIARRGRCSYIYSDCGTNFVGASREIYRLLQTAAESENLNWHFNPPSAPHFGGLWEAGIKSVKTHLARVIGDQILTYEEFNTVLVQIEAVLNSRPLCPVSSDPNDISALTPGHFLTLEPVSVVPDDDLRHLKVNRLTRWQLLQRLHQDFWSRWHTEYLHTLQQRSKWTKSSNSIIVGELVLIKNEQLPPAQWKLARVLETHPGEDGIHRVATLRTAQGIIKRPLVKICPLPMSPLN